MKRNQYTMFRCSQPWGYYPPEVEERISKYEVALKAVNDKYCEQRRLCMEYKARIEQLQDELRRMHLEMSSLELPETDEAISHFVLDDFKNYNNPSSNDYPDPDINIATEEDKNIDNSFISNPNPSKKIKISKKNSDDDFIDILNMDDSDY